MKSTEKGIHTYEKKKALGANETGKVIHDNECREYMEGWNANNCGKHFLANPYGCMAYDGELNRLWEKGFNENQKAWDDPSVSIDLPKDFSAQQIEDAFTITDHYHK